MTLGSARRQRGRVPAEMTGFAGRGVGLYRVRTRLENARPVTPVGPGGVGRTRPARRAAAQASAEYEHGVRFCRTVGTGE